MYVCKLAFEDNIVDPFTKALVAKSFERHVEAVITEIFMTT